MDARLYTCLIIRRNGEYLVGRTLWGRNELRWSISPYDAWRTRDREKAARVARKTGGITMLFNPVSGKTQIL